MKTVAIIGTTASGKSDLAHNLARKSGAALLSMDSLSVYRGIDIASAKPATGEREGLTYFGLDIANAGDRFGADDFAAEYARAREFCEANGRDLIIVGGSSFYLKAIACGLSPIPPIDARTACAVDELLGDLAAAHARLSEIDPIYAARIDANDRYRIEKALLIALASGVPPTRWFAENPPRPVLESVAIAEVVTDREVLRERIGWRTKKMIAGGLIDEVEGLLKSVPRDAQAMKAIGIKETIDFIDGAIDLGGLEELITIHTAQLAKRQRTYNNGQFNRLISMDINALENWAIKWLELAKNKTVD
ncbi:tRNA dimethylallyltransferase [Campylobacterota bacterium]|nr:tRNA dimethylallyltransferase [Campylobacterota bacterium]